MLGAEFVGLVVWEARVNLILVLLSSIFSGLFFLIFDSFVCIGRVIDSFNCLFQIGRRWTYS